MIGIVGVVKVFNLFMLGISVVIFGINTDLFFEMASQANISEIEAGKLAINKGNAEVVKIGRKMVADYTQAEGELMALAGKQGLNISITLDDKHKKKINDLNLLSGQAFDSAYMASQFIDHKNAIALFSEESKSGIESQAKTYAGKYLPKLQINLQMFEDKGTAVKSTIDSGKKK